MHSFFRSLVKGAVLALLLMLGTNAAAQQASGTLRGQVTDEFGGIVIGATVSVVDASGVEKTAVTNDEGVYVINAIAPGSYTVRASATGFAAFESIGVEIAAGRRDAFNIKLAVALEKQEVTVTGDAPVSTEPENNASALVIKGTDLDALPDDPDDLAAALQALAGPAAGPDGGQIFIDGFTGGRLPPKESIREIRINSNPFSAEYDRLGFGRIEILTRPGTDRLRGQTFFNFSDESLNSRDPFARTRAPFQSRQYGGNLSGPIVKKKASFFFDFEKRDVDGNSIINAPFIDPVSFDFTRINRTVITPNRRTTFSPRVDYQLNASNTLVARYSYERTRLDNQGVSETSLDLDPFFGLDRTFATARNEQTVQVTETAILGPTVINETRFQFQHSTRDSGGDISRPTISVRDAFTAGGASTGTNGNRENRYELQNYTSFTRGTQSFKFGARVRGVQISDSTQQNFNGNFTFAGVQATPTTAGLSSLEQFRLVRQGVAGFRPSQLSITVGDPLADVSQTDLGIFLQDDWRARPNLTLSAGLRYETQSNISSHFNFAPRLSFAYSPRAGGARQPQTVIRGGFGIFYNRFGENLTLQANRFNGTNQQQFIISDPLPSDTSARAEQARAILSNFPNVPADASLLSGFARAQTIRRVATDTQAPYTIQSTISVERQLPGRITATVNYINSRTLHLLRARNVNAPFNGVRPFGDAAGNIYQFESSGIFNQNQLIISANSRLNPKFTIFSNYILGRSNADTDGAGTFPANSYDTSDEYSRASGDVRHRFIFGGSFTAPFDIRLNPFVIAASGAPFNITVGRDLNGDTLFTDRPAFATDQTRPESLRHTSFGDFDLNPLPGQALIPRNFGQSPGSFTVNLRVNKTFGFGNVGGAAATTADGQAQPGGARGGGGGGRRGGGDGGGGRGGGGGLGGGIFGGGPGGPSGGSGAGRAEKRYYVTFGVNFNNLLNHTNPGPVVGNLSSPDFGRSIFSGGRFGGFGGGGGGGNADAGNRRVELNLRFSF